MANKRAYVLGDYDPSTRSIRVLASTPNPVEGEALESWDLSRFEKNPVVLWMHDPAQMALGTAEAVADGPAGLSMLIRLVSRDASPIVGYIENQLQEKALRGVSVGYEPGASRQEVRDGQLVMVRDANVLLEVSFVPIPKDEDAGTAALHTDAGEIRRAEIERFDAALSKVEFTAWGTARIPARICRVGVLDYPGRREFRPPNEVLKADSVETMRGVPVIDIKDHTDFVRPQDFRRKVLGFVEDVHVDGEYVAGTLHIHDGPTIDAIKRGERLDVSAGYLAPTVRQEGVWRGERYDVVQRDIIYNHVALCPPGRGRAGPEVGMKLDTTNAGDGRGRQEKTMKVIVINGKEYEVGSQAHLDCIEATHKAEVTALTSKVETLTGKLDSAEQAVTAAKREKTEGDTRSNQDLAQRVKSRVRLLMRAIRLFGEDDGEEQDDEKKMDAFCEMTERDIHLKAIHAVDPDFKADGKSDDYIAGKFEGDVKRLEKSRGVDGVVRVIEGGLRTDSKDGAGPSREHPLDKARRENRERMRTHATPAAAGEGGAR